MKLSQGFFLAWCICDAIVWFAFLIGMNATGKSRKTLPETVAQSHAVLFCPNCGRQFPAGKKFCDQCGSALKETFVTDNVTYRPGNPQDAKSTGFGVLGFFFPVIGLILYLVWKDTMPLKARSTGKGALAGAITGVILTILLVVIYFVILASLF